MYDVILPRKLGYSGTVQVDPRPGPVLAQRGILAFRARTTPAPGCRGENDPP
jgi:hypothetical protein